jgi:hypothetical protein
MKMKKIGTLVAASFCVLPVYAAVNFDSSYTSIEEKDCTTLKTDEVGSVQSCPSFGNIKVRVTEGDLRQSIILTRSGTDYPLNFQETVSANMSELGPKIEWRYKSGKPGNPVAMIVRLNISENPEKLHKTRSYLVVSKITTDNICVVGKVPPQRKQNQKARTMAEQSADMPCLNPPPLNIGVMVGEEYADYCSFSTPADSKKFVFDNKASWRFIFSSTMDDSARMRLNGKIVQLRLVRLEEDKTSQTVHEFYEGDSGIKVEITKTAVNTWYESTDYTGTLSVEKNGVVKEVSFVGDCGV